MDPAKVFQCPFARAIEPFMLLKAERRPFWSGELESETTQCSELQEDRRCLQAVFIVGSSNVPMAVEAANSRL
jgi:hypothetical protein